MAELLVFTQNKVRLDRTPEQSTALLKRGDLVVAKENGSPWGRAESKAVHLAEGGLTDEWGTFAQNPGGQLRFMPHPYVLLKVPDLLLVDALKAFGKYLRPAEEGRDIEFDAPDEPDRWIKVHQQVWRIDLDIMTPPEVEAAEATLTLLAFERAMDHKVERVEFDHTAPDGKGTVPPGRI